MIDFNLRAAVESVTECSRSRPKKREGTSYASTPSACEKTQVASPILKNLVGSGEISEQGRVVLQVRATEDLWRQRDTALRSDRHRHRNSTGEARLRFSTHSHRLMARPRDEFGGTGLGLSIAKRLVTLMNGSIGVESAIGQGARFWITVPMVVQPSLQRSGQLPVAELRHRKVCIVDDDPAGRTVLEQYTTSWSMQPSSAADALGALALLRRAAQQKHPIDGGCRIAASRHRARAKDPADPFIAATPVIILDVVWAKRRSDARYGGRRCRVPDQAASLCPAVRMPPRRARPVSRDDRFPVASPLTQRPR